MSSSTITVSPQEITASSSSPVMKTVDPATNKGTILLRNPLPKYSFQAKLDKKEAGKVDKEAGTGASVKKNKVNSKIVPDNEKKTSIAETKITASNIESNVGNKNKSETDTNKLNSLVQQKDKTEKQTELNSDLRIGVLVNSFPQSSVQNVAKQTLESQLSVNQTINLKTESDNVETGIAKLMKEKPKPVNIVDPISSSGRLSHSFSESEICSSSSGIQRSSRMTSSQEQTGLTQNTSDVLEDEIAETGPDTGTLIALVGSASEETRRCNCNAKIKHLEEEKQLLKQQLEVQLQVNCELKKLLVASVGDDLHHRVERLTRDKALLSMELGDYSRKIEEDYEHLDKILIQADMWRSKYLASRVMTDELASAKAFYSMQYQECQVALQQLLNERHELRANLFETYRGLHQIKGAFDPLNSENSSSQLSSKHVIDLARANQQLTDAIKYRLLPSHVTASLSNKIEPDWHDYLTKAEAHARELLAREVRPEDFRHLVPKSLTAPAGMIVDRFHPCTRFDNLTINVCCKCKGDVTIV